MAIMKIQYKNSNDNNSNNIIINNSDNDHCSNDYDVDDGCHYHNSSNNTNFCINDKYQN